MKLLIDHRMQPRMSKLERIKRTIRKKEKGLPPPPLPKKGLLSEAMSIVDEFIRREKFIRDHPQSKPTVMRSRKLEN